MFAQNVIYQFSMKHSYTILVECKSKNDFILIYFINFYYLSYLILL